MDSKMQMFVKKQNQLQEQIEKLFAEKKILQKQMHVLNECLSLEKIKEKVSDLEKKEKILVSLEDMVNKLRIEIQPLNYLRKLLQSQLMVSDTKYLNIEEQKDSESSQFIVNSECANETLDSVSDVSSEDSVMVLSDFDFVSDEEVMNNSTNNVPNKVLYEEALLMASSSHSLSFTLPISDIEFSPNVDGPIENSDCLLKSSSKVLVRGMNTSCASEQLLDMYDIVDKQEPNGTENDKIKFEDDIETFENVMVFDKNETNSFDNKNVCSSLSDNLDDYWVQGNKNDSIEISNTSEHVDVSQEIAIAILEEDNTKPNESQTVAHKVIQICVPGEVLNKDKINLLNNDENCHFSEPENINDSWIQINTNDSPVISNKNNLIDVSKEIAVACLEENNTSKMNSKVETSVLLKDQILNSQCESKDIAETNISNVSQDIVINHLEENNTSSEVNSEIKTCMVNDQFLNSQCESKDITEINSSKNISVVNCDYKNAINNPVCSTVSKDEIKISSQNTDGCSVIKECQYFSSVDNSFKLFFTDDNVSHLSFQDESNIKNLKKELIKGITKHGFQDLTTLQKQFLSHSIAKSDIIFYSYPCIGKTTMCLISVLQRINTSLNHCQAIILVPSLELAFSTQKTMKSMGKYLKVSTCIGGINVPRKVSPVPHVVISTPRGLCDMINCNSLYKNFIKMLVIDDAGEMLATNRFFNQIRQVLLFLNKNRQLIILSSSKLEEILDQFSDEMLNPVHLIEPDEKPSLSDISQYYVSLPENWKYDALCELYEALNLSHTVVYCDTLFTSLTIAENMRLKTYTVSAVDNEMNTSQREQILQQFRSGSSRLLVTTSLLKGEIFPDVLWVINYNLPKNPKDFVRRIIGHFSRQVKVLNFISVNDITAMKNIETAFNTQMFEIPQDLSKLCTHT